RVVSILSLLATMLVAPLALAAPPTISMGTNGLIAYGTDDLGNRITDFSYAGYKAGGVALPTLPNKITLGPSGSDDTTAIQNAINTVAGMPPDNNSFRGAILLKPGNYTISATLKISVSGVVLRGAGPSTIINSAGVSPLSIAGTG